MEHSPSISRASTEDPDDELPGKRPSFAGFPPIFVLPTHLTLDELHQVEETLADCRAPLTYDVSEAKLVLGKVSQKKRAALELRSRGLWTEEVSNSTPSPEPPVKRRRLERGVEKQLKTRTEESEVINLDTESENEVDGETSHHVPAKHLRKAKSPSPAAASTTSCATTSSSLALAPAGEVKVVKLEWFHECMEARKSLSPDPYVVYRARVIPRPENLMVTAVTRFDSRSVSSASPSPTRSSKDTDAKRILDRAREDAASKPSPSFMKPHVATRRSREREDGRQSQWQPPKLYRQTTSEHDAAVPLPPAPDWVKNNITYACMRSAPLHPPNERFIEQLIKIRRARELTLDEIGVRAYSTSIAAIAAYPYEFRTPMEVLSLPGCDTKIASLFAEFKESPDGTVAAARVLDTDPVLRTLHTFYNIWGVGAKTARDFYYLREWRDLDDVIEHGWDTLSRVQQIGVKYYDEFGQGIPRAEVEEIGRIIHRHANRVRPGCEYDGRGVECIIVGGYRRGKDVSGDVDLVLSHRNETVTKNLVVDVVRSLEEEGWITHTLSLHMTTSHRDQQTLPFRGDDPPGQTFDTLDKALVVWQDPHYDDNDNDNDHNPNTETETDLPPEDQARAKRRRNPNPHRRVDIIISPWRTVGCAVLGWSGDTTFERDLRRYARKAHRWKFDSSGVRERTSGGQVIDLERGGATWEEREKLVMEGLGVGWRPATERCTR
ncbi:hypothetical protein DTO164E3_2691 [Paecilomyces variotii]|nr:hypothetical protein DTO164E3_2691 [Paecilomyces variotii]KAJ9314088.1 hypothetical protein DTO271D3_5565 [Paecilomyces variotii]KAJ9362102.1 hypothetical protein DTO027B9_533 [Paecilomyces variotii]